VAIDSVRFTSDGICIVLHEEYFMHFIPCGYGNIVGKFDEKDFDGQRVEVVTYSRLANYFNERSAYNGNLERLYVSS